MFYTSSCFFVITTVLMITLQRLEMSQSGYGTISAFICIIHLGFFENKGFLYTVAY